MNRLVTQKYSVHSGNLILVNAHQPLLDTPAKDMLVPVNSAYSHVLLERQAAVLLNQLMGDIGGWRSIAAVSGWRSREEQQEIWDSSTVENGLDFTSKYVALPGHSEHQTGLAIDLGLMQETIDFIRPDFPYSGICQTFRKKAPQYGFIQRYPAGQEDSTGIAHEPWHFRYVGVPHAQIITQLGFTLEEYHSFLQGYPFGAEGFVYETGNLRFAISHCPMEASGSISMDGDDGGCTMVSGNNSDGFVVTTWKNRAC